METKPLYGIRVLDFTRVLAGPFCTMLLGDMGADVIKIEASRGDDTRSWGPPWTDETENRLSAYYLSINRNKRSIVLNLKAPEGQQIARQLAQESHILIENFKPGQMKKFGLDYPTLKTTNPALVYASITGFGQYGSYHNQAGYDHIIQAMSGLMSITGSPDSEGYKVGVAVSDVITGLFTLSGVLAALRKAEASGEGDYLDIALLDSQMAGLVNVVSNTLISGKTPQRYGNQHANIVPYQNFGASDGQFALAVGNDLQFAGLCHIIDRREWITDERFATNPARVENRHILIPLLQAIFEQQPVSFWIEHLTAQGIPAGKINTVDEALNDPYMQERNLIHQVMLASGVEVPLMGSPLTSAVEQAPPIIGQHTRNVFSEMLSYTDKEIDDLQEKGVIHCAD